MCTPLQMIIIKFFTPLIKSNRIFFCVGRWYLLPVYRFEIWQVMVSALILIVSEREISLSIIAEKTQQRKKIYLKKYLPGKCYTL